MREIRFKYLKLYIRYLRQFMLSLLEYRLDFIFGISSMLFIHLGTLMFIYLIFERITEIKGYNYYEIIFIFGFSILPQSFLTMFCSTIFNFSWYIRTGEFDRILLRPVNPLFQIISTRIDQNGFGNLILGFIILIYSWIKLEIQLSFFNLLMLIFLLISAFIILFSIHIILASISFFVVRNENLVMMVHELDEFTYYPITIYNKGIQIVLSTIIPLAFASFYPAVFFLKKNVYLSYFTIPLALLFFSFSLKLFYYGISRYESTGH